MKSYKVIDKYSTKWFEEVVMNYFPVPKKPVVLVPCTSTKPHQNSLRKTLPKIVSLHEAKELSIIIVSDLLTLIPFDNEEYNYDYPPWQLTEGEIKVLRERLYLWFKNNLLGKGRPHSLFGALHPQHQEIVIPPLLKVGKTFSGLLVVRNFCWSMVDDILTEWRIRNRNIEENVVSELKETLPCKYSTILEQILKWVKEKGSICGEDLRDEFFAPYFLEQGTVPLNWYTEGYKICKIPYLIKKGDKRVFNSEMIKEVNEILN